MAGRSDQPRHLSVRGLATRLVQFDVQALVARLHIVRSRLREPARSLLWNGGGAPLAYLPATDSWKTLAGGALSARESPASVWADGIFITWSGFHNKVAARALLARVGIDAQGQAPRSSRTGLAPRSTLPVAACSSARTDRSSTRSDRLPRLCRACARSAPSPIPGRCYR